MKLLEDLINDHYVEPERREILLLFNKYDLVLALSKITNYLRTAIQNCLELKERAPVTIIATSGSNLLVSANSRLGQIGNQQEKRRLQVALSQIGIRMLLSIVRDFPEQAIEIFDQVKQALRQTSEMLGYDYNDINNLLNFDEYENLIHSLTGIKQANEIKQINVTPRRVLLWTKRTNIGFLTSVLKKRNWIKSQHSFEKLFENVNKDFTVFWNMKYKYELAHLLLMLKNSDFIRPQKGFFSLTEKHIVDYSGNFLSKNSLKKISSKITQNPEKYTQIIESVDEIMKSITPK